MTATDGGMDGDAATGDTDGGSDGGTGGAGGAGGVADAPCPSRDEARAQLQISGGGCGLRSVDGDGGRMGQMCCYNVTIQYCIGRPFLDNGRPLVAGILPGSDAWLAAVAPDLSDLGPEERAALASAYAGDALLEHASIASFARFSLELLAVGAPPSL